jgi:predicted adenine nucleotide alpha hydrolase (AANH) superfamily ATPase
MSSLLLHTCCAPCATGCIEHWRHQGTEITLFWYNPNIHAFAEHQRRLQSLQEYVEKASLPLIVAEGYDIVDYFRSVAGNERERCGYCFRLRLSMTAAVAKLRGFEAFSTTLLISPYQNQGLLKQMGEEVAQKQGIRLAFEDLRPSYAGSRRASKELDLYRQEYCGCIYSEWERVNRTSRRASGTAFRMDD